MNGFLNRVDVESVLRYEAELLKFVQKTIFYLPLNYALKVELPRSLVLYLLNAFTNAFIKRH